MANGLGVLAVGGGLLLGSLASGATQATAISTSTVDTLEVAQPVPLMARAVGPLAAASWDSVNLARATHLWHQGDLRGAVPLLETIDISQQSAFALADRAALLLAVAHLRLGDREAFLRVAQMNKAGDNAYRQWLQYVRLLVTGTAEPDMQRLEQDFWKLPGTVVLTAASLLESGHTNAAAQLLNDRQSGNEFAALHRYLEALAVAEPGRKAIGAWRDLAAEVSAASLAPAQVHALLALAAGDSAAAREIFADKMPDEVNGPEARGVVRMAGQLEAAAMAWTTALQYYDTAMTSWEREANWLESLAESDQASAAWETWTRWTPRENEIPLPDLNWSAALGHLAGGATDLTRDAVFQRDDFQLITDPATGPLRPQRIHAQTHGPDQDQWRRWDSLMAAQNQAEAELERRKRALADLEIKRDRRLAYLASGRRSATERTAELDRVLAELDLMLARLDLALADLDRTRAEALRQFAQRAATLIDDLRTSLIYVQAVRHFHVEGPAAKRKQDWPAGVPSPAELLDLEEALADEALAFLTLFGERVPELVNRSCREVWVPRLAVDGPALRLAVAAEQQRGLRLIAGIDSTAGALPITEEIVVAAARLEAQATALASLAQQAAQMKQEIVSQVIASGEARLQREREGLDYQYGDALYWVAVGEAGEPGSSEAGRRARHALREYLDNYPQGRGRAEARYRLADLELLQARDDFQTRMAGFLEDGPTSGDLQNKALAPFVNYDPAIILYRRILAEDPDFAHLPAVLFQLGMILGDVGDPDSSTHLETLVARYPDSAFVQEAWLRLGDQHFEAREFAACRPCFAEAARGDDPSLRAIALYKLGWAHLEQDQFAAAATAFGSLLDQNVAADEIGPVTDNPRLDTDLEDEARQYLVHSLIRAGGAEAFTEHFAQVGPRDYEADILISMGHQLAGVSLYGEAITCDRLWLDRFGEGDRAVAVSERLVAGYQRWHKPAAARRIHLEQAQRFLPGQPWLAAQTDLQLQDDSQEFARAAYQRAAVHAHQQARQSKDPAAWRLALQHYDGFLQHWPDHEQAFAMHLQAGEAAHRLDRHAVALAHFEVAASGQHAAADTNAIAAEAAWQVVAVSDAWYRETRSGKTATTGPDSLARRLLTAIDWYQDRNPDADQMPTLMWRKGQVAYAHGWYEEAAGTLADLGRTYPDDDNALAAVRLSGDAWYQLSRYVAAGAAYEQTLTLARQVKADTVVVAMEPIIPRCYYQHAEQVAAADTVTGAVQAAPLFAKVAANWPAFEHADQALYRTGLGYEAGADPVAATTAWEILLADYPDSRYARDSALRIAAVQETAGNWQAAAAALDRFSDRFATDADAAAALLKAGDLLASGGDTAGSESMKTAFLQRYPGETEDVMDIREERVLRSLAATAPGQSLNDLAGLQAYLKLAAAHPEWASPVILAQVDFHKADAAHARYTALVLTQPLPAAVVAKQESLE